VSTTYVSKALRCLVSAQAKQRCGYCLSPQRITGTPMEIEHSVPERAGGLTIEANLWLACKLCNDHKSDRLDASDPLTDQIVALFNPRTQQWTEH
jgi:5-methylcytosine-specific restriction endonuclease McrA